MKTKLVKAAGRFGSRYGQYVRRRIAGIESKQRQKQICIFCNGYAKRLAKGIWKCKKCKRTFAAHAYYLEKGAVKIKLKEGRLIQQEKKSKPLKKQEIKAKKEKTIKKTAKTKTK